MKSKGRIFIVAQGGLANRMRAIASALHFAVKLHRKLIVVWYRDKGLNASFSDLFITDHLPFSIIEPGNTKYNLIYEIPRKRNLFLSKIIRLITGFKSIDNINHFSEDIILKKLESTNQDIIINSGLQFAPLDSHFLNQIFRFNDTVVGRAINILDGNTPEYALQIRRTDNIESIKNSPICAFEKILENKLECKEKVLVFLATDDISTKHYLISKYPDKIITNYREARRDTREGMIDAAAEMLIMSECKIIYGSYWSSFPEIAALYGVSELIVVKGN